MSVMLRKQQQKESTCNKADGQQPRLRYSGWNNQTKSTGYDELFVITRKRNIPICKFLDI